MIATEDLAALIVDVADTLVVDFDVVDFLQTVTTRTAELTRADASGLLLADERRHLRFMAASAEADLATAVVTDPASHPELTGWERR